MERYTVSITVECNDISEAIETAAQRLNEGTEPDQVTRTRDDNGYNVEDVTKEAIEAEAARNG